MERAPSTRLCAPDGTGDAAVYLMFLAVGLGVVIPTLCAHLPFGADATAGAVFVVFSLWGIASLSWNNVVRRK